MFIWNIAEKEIIIENKSKDLLLLEITGDCDCLSFEPDHLSLSSHERGVIKLIYDSKDDIGIINKAYTIKTNRKDLHHFEFTISGKVISADNSQQKSTQQIWFLFLPSFLA